MLKCWDIDDIDELFHILSPRSFQANLAEHDKERGTRHGRLFVEDLEEL